MSGLSILYVEDDASIAEMYRIGLQHAGHEVTIAPTGTVALEQLEADSFDLVLLDVMLPGMDGLEVLEEIRTRPFGRDLKVAILSNSELGRAAHMRARRLGILAWLTKIRNPPPTVARAVRRWFRLADLTSGSRGG